MPFFIIFGPAILHIYQNIFKPFNCFFMLKHHVAQKLGISEMNLGNVKNIIFDLGNVIVDIHYDRTLDAFRKLGFSDFEKIYTIFKQTDLFTLLEIGRIPGDEFCQALREYGMKNLNNDDIKKAWSLMIGDLTPQTYELLKYVRTGFRTFLLSNTNEIHIDYFSNQIREKFGRNILSEMFEKSYYSHTVHLRKPNKEIYEFVLNDATLVPSETIFIDDLKENIDAARETGILGYHLEKERIGELFIL
jgi:glucose-1-phosphatase